MTAHVVQHRRDLVLWQFLDQPEQFLALHAHNRSLRRRCLPCAQAADTSFEQARLARCHIAQINWLFLLMAPWQTGSA